MAKTLRQIKDEIKETRDKNIVYDLETILLNMEHQVNCLLLVEGTIKFVLEHNTFFFI